MSASNTPPAEVSITPELVGGLLQAQHPDLAHLPLRPLANGWDNVIYRLGDDLTVRIPRREVAAELVRNEQRCLPLLAPRLPLPVPVPVRTGRPSEDYPWSWSVLPWFEGTAVGNRPMHRPAEVAEALGTFLAALHVAAPGDAPTNEFRGGPLTTRDRSVAERLERLPQLPATADVDTLAVADRWRLARDAPPSDGPALWLHGDLHPFNLLGTLGDDGETIDRLTAVIDFGDITAGDPATDLAIAWSRFDEPARSAVLAAADSDVRPIDEAMRLRAQGWALVVGLALLVSSQDNPAYLRLGRRMVDAVLATPV